MPMYKLLLYSLAVWRACSLLYDEEGPWGVARKFRTILGIEHDEEGNPVIYPSYLQPLQCFWCLTLFASLPILVYNGHLVWLASSAGAILMERWILRSKARLF